MKVNYEFSNDRSIHVHKFSSIDIKKSSHTSYGLFHERVTRVLITSIQLF